MDNSKPVICVFCGSSHGSDAAFAEAARHFGTLIAERGYDMVFGGGNLGLMGETARAARRAGAKVVGVLPDILKAIEDPKGLDETLLITPDLFTRKARMFQLSDAFAVLPGGLGTLDELLEALTAAQLGIHAKPVVLLNLSGFFDPFLEMISHTIKQGFAGPEVHELMHVANSVETAIEHLVRLFPPR